MLRQPRPEHIRAVPQSRTFTNRALTLDRPTDFACRPHEFGMGIAHLAAIKHAVSIVGQNRGAGQPIVDMAL